MCSARRHPCVITFHSLCFPRKRLVFLRSSLKLNYEHNERLYLLSQNYEYIARFQSMMGCHNFPSKATSSVYQLFVCLQNGKLLSSLGLLALQLIPFIRYYCNQIRLTCSGASSCKITQQLLSYTEHMKCSKLFSDFYKSSKYLTSFGKSINFVKMHSAVLRVFACRLADEQADTTTFTCMLLETFLSKHKR